MKTLAGALVAVLLATAVVEAQTTSQVYSTPRVPTRAELERLNLVEGWHTVLPTDGRRDGLVNVQLFDDRIIVLLKSGGLLSLDPATGGVQWSTRVGVPYVPAVGFAANAKLLFVAKGVNIYAFRRSNGNLVWDLPLPHAPSAAPVADDERLFIPMGTNRLHAYLLPDLDAPPPAAVAVVETMRKEKVENSAPKPAESAIHGNPGKSALGVSGQTIHSISAVFSGGRTSSNIGPLSSAIAARQVGSMTGPQPEPLWDYLTETQPETRLEQNSILTADFLFQAGANGMFFVLSKYEPRIYYRYQADASVAAAIGEWGEKVYVPSDDFRVYALDIVAGKILWRFVGGGPIRQKPRVTDDSVYVSAERAGLYRLNRANGDTIWRNPEADRFLAVNDRFVYANDPSGRLMILDRARGTRLAVFEGTRDFNFPISNELNDRVYLASNDGLFVSLHDRDHAKPMRVKNIPDLKPTFSKQEPKKPKTEKALAKPAEKPKDKDTDTSPDK